HGASTLATSGAISGTGSGANVQLGKLTTGSASVANADAAGDTASSGNITLSGASLGTNASPAPQTLALGAATAAGGGVLPGVLNLTATAGNIFVSSDAVLRVKDITTQAATANTVDIRTTTGKALSFESTGTYTGVAGDGTAANGDAVNIVTTGAGGTVTFDKALAAGSITVDAAGAVTGNQALSTSAVTTTGTGVNAITGAISLTAAGAGSGAGTLTTGAASADDAAHGANTLATSGAISEIGRAHV